MGSQLETTINGVSCFPLTCSTICTISKGDIGQRLPRTTYTSLLVASTVHHTHIAASCCWDRACMVSPSIVAYQMLL